MSAPGSLKVQNLDAGALPPEQSYKPAFSSSLRQHSTSHAPSPEPGPPSTASSARPPTLPPLQGMPGLSAPTPHLQPQRDLERSLSQQQASTATSLPPPAKRDIERTQSSSHHQQQQQVSPLAHPPKPALSLASPERSFPPDTALSEATSPLQTDALSSRSLHSRPPKHVPPLQESNSGVRYAHHAFVPKPRAQSAFMRRHQAAHPTPAQRMRMVGPKGSASARPRRRVPMTSLPEDEASLLNGGNDTWSHTSSMGDLEALDTILDTLVVADPRMRIALLQGPLVSFETVVPQPKPRKLMADEDTQDKTFNLTSVPGVVEEGMEEDAFPPPPALDQPDMEALRARALQEQEEADRREREQQQQQQQAAAAQEQLLRERQRQLAGVAAAEEQAERPTLNATAVVPVPILPKLARMYISSKQTQAAKVPPPPPPTAHWLVHSRPHPSPQAAPSYDTLCNQIRDVQRQYTCGTSPAHAVAAASEHEPGRPPRVNPNLGMYISGLDGPPLDEVAQAQGLPQGVERSRPSFVAMQQSKRKAMRSRSPGQGGVRRNSLDVSSYLRRGDAPDAAMQATGENVRGDESFDSD